MEGPPNPFPSPARIAAQLDARAACERQAEVLNGVLKKLFELLPVVADGDFEAVQAAANHVTMASTGLIEMAKRR